MEITGKILMFLSPQTGNGKNGPWKKQDFVIETTDNYPKKVCLSAWGDKVGLEKYQPGQQVKVMFDVESREYNGKWYTDLKAFGMQPLQGGGQVDQPQENFVDGPDQDDLPF
jgi:hypothetical protein